MGKHRKQQHYRRFVIGAVVLGAVGVPSIAMACGEWQDGEAGQPSPAAAPAGAAAAAYTAGPWQYGAQVQHHRHHRHHGHRAGETAAAKPAAPVTVPPAPSAPSAPSAPQSTAPKPSPTATAPAAAPTAPAARPSSPKPTASTSAPAPATGTPQPAATASSAVARIVQLVNAERSKVGCSALTLNATLTKVAQAHSDDMAAHQNMSHTGSDGSSPGDRITGAGYAWSSYGENVAYGYATPEDVMAGWMASPGHRENILNCAFKEIGVGLAQPNSYWTQDFGTSR